jgi:hypothetical protein
MRQLHPMTVLAFGAVLIGAAVTMTAPYIPDDWGWFLTMTVFGMGGGFFVSVAIGTVTASMCLGAAFGELLIMAGKPELNASPIAWSIFTGFALLGVALVHLSNVEKNQITRGQIEE